MRRTTWRRQLGEDIYIYHPDGTVEYEWIQPKDYEPPETQEHCEMAHFKDIDCLQELFSFA